MPARNNLSSGAYDDSLAARGVNLLIKISPVSAQDPSIMIPFLSKLESNRAFRCSILLVILSGPWLVT